VYDQSFPYYLKPALKFVDVGCLALVVKATKVWQYFPDEAVRNWLDFIAMGLKESVENFLHVSV